MDTTPQSKTSILLDSLDAGDVMREADEALAEVTKAVEMTGKPGSITITIALDRKKPGVMSIKPKVTKKAPQDEANVSIRYLLPGGDLSMKDPSQREFDFQNNVTVMPTAAKESQG